MQKFDIFLDFTGQVLLLLEFVLLTVDDLIQGKRLSFKPLYVALQLGNPVVIAELFVGLVRLLFEESQLFLDFEHVDLICIEEVLLVGLKGLFEVALNPFDTLIQLGS